MATTPWNQLKLWMVDKLPDNDQQRISPQDVRDVFSEVMDSFEKMLVYLITTPEQRSIKVLNKSLRSWPITLTSGTNSIGFFAYTTISRRALILNKNFKVDGSGINRTLIITDPYFDDFADNEELVWVENVRGAAVDFKLPEFKIQQVNGIPQYGWNYPESPAEEFQPIGDVGAPMFSPAKAFSVAALTKTTVLTHEFNSTKIDVRIKNSRGGELSFVTGYPVSKSQIAFDMEDGAGYSDVTVFLYVFPD